MLVTKHPIIGFIDSGVGGLTILAEVRSVLPKASLVYCADKGYFPYGIRSDQEICERLLKVSKALLKKHSLDILVIACNTASTIALDVLRHHLNIPIVGVVPAVKPAGKLTKTKKIAVLSSEATAKRAYTMSLISRFASDCEVTLIGSQILVEQGESKLNGKTVDLSLIKQEVEPILQNPDVDTVVLACTHFPLLIDELRTLIPQAIHWLDTGAAVALRVKTLLEDVPKIKTWYPWKRLVYFDTASAKQTINFLPYFGGTPQCEYLSI